MYSLTTGPVVLIKRDTTETLGRYTFDPCFLDYLTPRPRGRSFLCKLLIKRGCIPMDIRDPRTFKYLERHFSFLSDVDPLDQGASMCLIGRKAWKPSWVVVSHSDGSTQLHVGNLPSSWRLVLHITVRKGTSYRQQNIFQNPTNTRLLFYQRIVQMERSPSFLRITLLWINDQVASDILLFSRVLYPDKRFNSPLFNISLSIPFKSPTNSLPIFR